MDGGGTDPDAPKDPSRGGVQLHAHLAVALEADRPLAGGLRLDLDGVDRVVIGRGCERRCERRDESGRSTIVLQVPGPAISSTHAELRREGPAWTVHDLRSTNGTFVNGRAVSAQELAPGDALEMGHTLFVFMGELVTPPGSARVADLSSSVTASGMTTLIPSFHGELESLARWAASRLPLLVLGETGTGKELVARSVHAASGRDGRLVPVNCAGLPSTLVEAQLFGHSRGAFSGAVRDEPGFVRAADRGTLFLDEIGDLPVSAQGALLRVLQEGEVVPLGTSRAVSVDVRVVAATNRDLAAMATAGAFRADLLARLDGAVIRLPPLRDRRADLGLLTATLLRRLAGARAEAIRLEPAAALALALHAWPANVRELEQCLARAVVVADGVLRLEHLSSAIAATLERRRSPAPANSQGELHLRDALVAQLRAQGGNVAAVGRVFGKAPAQVHRWMRRFGIDPNAYRDRVGTPENRGCA